RIQHEQGIFPDVHGDLILPLENPDDLVRVEKRELARNRIRVEDDRFPAQAPQGLRYGALTADCICIRRLMGRDDETLRAAEKVNGTLKGVHRALPASMMRPGP